MDKDGLLAWEDDRELENYIVSGGVYGSDDNYRLNTVVNYGSRLKFAVKVLFPPLPDGKDRISVAEKPSAFAGGMDLR